MLMLMLTLLLMLKVNVVVGSDVGFRRIRNGLKAPQFTVLYASKSIFLRPERHLPNLG